jgi:hypothetical protein
MAEVRPAPAKTTNEPIVTEKTTTPAAPKEALEPALQSQAANEAAAATSAVVEADKVSNVEVFSDASVAEVPVAGVLADEVASELKKEAVLEPNAAGKVALDMADTTVPFTTTTGHTVDQAELVRNATIADVTVRTVATARAEQATSKALERKLEREKGKAQKDDQSSADVTAYLGLLRAAW